MKVKERIAGLRALMAEKHIDAYIIPSSDNHQSEYVGEHFKARAFITGFTGSSGDAIITKDSAGLWTDSRYFIQAEKQLEGSGVTLFKMGEPGVPSVEDYLQDVLSENAVLGFDGRVISVGEGRSLIESLSGKGITVRYAQDLIDEIWTGRPPLSTEPVFLLDEKYAGESTASKLERIRTVMAEHQANIHVIAALDDICWLINMRGNDVAYSPLILAYAIVRTDSVDLFIDETKLSDTARQELLKNDFRIHPYNNIYHMVEEFSATDTILLDPNKLNYALYNSIAVVAKKVELPNPTILFKAMKNDIEIANTIQAHIKDGVAVTRFMHWLKESIGKEKISELSATAKLEEFRKEGEGYLWQSFAPICGYRDHAAIIHYSSTEETNVELEAKHMLLVDTGGNYYEGSTDITRTIVLGAISEEEKLHFTLVAKSMIGLANAKFLYGCKGFNLDILAKKPLWDMGLDYKHGTGHGVGYLLNIHEGPSGFRWRVMSSRHENHELEAGMIITDEPGIYIEGSHGVRTENELVVRQGIANEFGQFMYFEPITYAPIDLDGINVDLLNEEERNYLNWYHQKVYETLSPHLDDETREWLKIYTREI